MANKRHLVRKAVHDARHVHLHGHIGGNNPKGRRRCERVGRRGNDFLRRQAIGSIPVTGHVHKAETIGDHDLALFVAVIGHDADGRVIGGVSNVAAIAVMGAGGRAQGDRKRRGGRCVDNFHGILSMQKYRATARRPCAIIGSLRRD